MDQPGHLATLGRGWITGHQNISEVAKKQACSTSCQESERSASSNEAGMGHAIKATEAAIQQTAGSGKKRPRHLTAQKKEQSSPTPIMRGNTRRRRHDSAAHTIQTRRTSIHN